MNITTDSLDAEPIDPDDASRLQDDLDRAMGTLRDEGSFFARVRLHVQARTIYYRLHPEAPKHGGDRTKRTDTVSVRSVSVNIWPAYTRYAAQLTGSSERSIRRDLEDGTKLLMASEKCISKTPLANDRGTLLRVGALSAPQQAEIATLYQARDLKKAKAQLSEYEAKAGIAPPAPRQAKLKRAPGEESPKSGAPLCAGDDIRPGWVGCVDTLEDATRAADVIWHYLYQTGHGGDDLLDFAGELRNELVRLVAEEPKSEAEPTPSTAKVLESRKSSKPTKTRKKTKAANTRDTSPHVALSGTAGIAGTGRRLPDGLIDPSQNAEDRVS